MLRRVDAENRLQTLKEELDFQKNIYSEVGTMLFRPEDQDWVATDTRVGAGGSAVCRTHLSGSLELVDGGIGRWPAPSSQVKVDLTMDRGVRIGQRAWLPGSWPLRT